MELLIYWLKQFVVVRWLWWVLRNLWPFFVFFRFWPEITGFMSRFEWWDVSVRTLSLEWIKFTHTGVYQSAASFLSDLADWAFGFASPLLTIIKDAAISVFNFVKGLFS